MHGEQDEAPEDAKVESLDLAASVAEYLPATQLVQLPGPVTSLYLPAPHAEQAPFCHVKPVLHAKTTDSDGRESSRDIIVSLEAKADKHPEFLALSSSANADSDLLDDRKTSCIKVVTSAACQTLML